MNLDILNKCTTHVRNTLSRSIDIAWELNEESIPPIFILAALAEQTESVGGQLLQQNNLTVQQLLPYVETHNATAQPSTSGILTPEFSTHTKKILERATALATDSAHLYIGTEHLLLAITQLPDESIQHLIQEYGVTIEDLQQQVTDSIESNAELNDMHALLANTGGNGTKDPKQQKASAQQQQNEHSATPALDYFGTDLTSQEHLVHLDPVIGRAEEIERIIHILARRNKNNPVLIGDPGVGKTAIVEGLAKRIAEGAVPDILANKQIIALDLALVLAGSMYRGEFESRFKQIIDEVKANPDIIVFIDEIHTLVGAGGVQGGTMDAANILKPALAKGDIRCIGATTLTEYRKYIESDSALERRFQKINVPEPTEEDAITIVKGIRERYELHHHVQLSDDVISAAVRWSVRFLPERRLPDKAIDLIDEASAKKLTQRKMPKVLKDLQRQIRLLNKLRLQKEHAVRGEQFNLAVNLKNKEQSLIEKIERLETQANALNIKRVPVSTDDIAHVVSVGTGIPVEHITAADRKRFEHIADTLQQTVVGQTDAITQIASVMKRSIAGLSRTEKPLGTFLFLGPSGVGKTLLAKTLAAEVFGSARSLIRVDMSEFSEGYTVSKLIGAPAGYVGYNDDSKLADKIRQRPYSVVLFDEIEKAHPDIFNLLLQVLDDGILTDATGRELNFRHSIIIMTSNIGIDLLNKQAALGFESTKKQNELSFEEISHTIMEELNEAFPQEFLNRIDHPIIFKPLAHTEVEKIVQQEFTAIQKRAAEQGITLRLLASARKYIAEKSFQPQEGARRVVRVLTEHVENPLADMIVKQHIRSGDSVKVGYSNKKVTLKKDPKK